MDKRKRLNRNAFNEKLIHRYLIERYYFATASERNALLPEKFKNLEINLIAPEEVTKGSGYRPDLTIYFKGEKRGIPVEIKWSLADMRKSNQINYINKNNGFVVALTDGSSSRNLESVIIDKNDFSAWIAENISRLTRESISSHSLEVDSSVKQFWLVFLRGTSSSNFERMLKTHSSAPFWAFQQHSKALKSILNIQRGDRCLFVIGSTLDKGQRMSYRENQKISYTDWFLAEIKDPNYMVLEGPRGTFFEKADVPIGERRWPHFIDFKISDQCKHEERVMFGQLGIWTRAFSESYNYGGGTPVQLAQSDFESLYDHLRYASQAQSEA